MHIRFCLAAMALLAPVSVGAVSFPDVADNHLNADAIAYVKAQGIVNGYPDGTFKPDQLITRAEFLKIVLEAEAAAHTGDGPGISPSGACFFHETKETFQSRFGKLPDVDFNAWYAPYVCYGMRSEVVKGYSDGTFRPAAQINFAEASKILVKALNAYEMCGTAECPLIGDYDHPWYETFVRGLESKHAIPTSITSMEQRITRGEMTEMIYRLNAHIMNKPSQTYDNLLSQNATSTVTISFYTENDLAEASYEANFPVTRSIPKTSLVADAALRALFAGPTQAEKNQGARTMDALSVLSSSYLGVTVQNGVAIVNFKPEALTSLNAAAGIQMQVKAAIETTLKHFPTVQSVQYAIDGKIFTEWDA